MKRLDDGESAHGSKSADIWVHVRMKECCRTVLGDLDQRKKNVPFKGGMLEIRSLSEAFGEMTIDAAKAALLSGGEAGEEFETLVRAACVKVCERHAAEHEGNGEMEEGGFWREMMGALSPNG